MNTNNKNVVQPQSILCFALTVCTSLTVGIANGDQRNVNTSWYVGGSLGQSQLSPDESGSIWELTGKTDMSQKIYLGKHLNDQISLEAFWTNLGSASVDSTEGDSSGDINYTGYGINAVYSLPYHLGNFKPFGKLGIAKFDTKDNGAASSRQIHSTPIIAGVGVDYKINDRMDIRTGFDYYDKDAQDLNVGLKWSPMYRPHKRNRVQKPEVVQKPVEPKVVYNTVKEKVVYVPKKIYIKPEPRKPSIQLLKRNLSGGSNFNTGSAKLTYQGESTLDKMVNNIDEQNIEISEIIIAGHTDSVGSHQANHLLSVNRAESVASYLASKGINQNLIRTVGYGETRPIADNRYKYGRAQNRRVEITVNGSIKLTTH